MEVLEHPAENSEQHEYNVGWHYSVETVYRLLVAGIIAGEIEKCSGYT